MTFSDEELSAFLDGELEEARMSEIAAAIDEDAELAARMEALSKANDLFAEAVKEIDDQTLPNSIMAVLRSEKLDAANDHEKTERKSWSQWRWDVPLAAAFALTVGTVLGSSMIGSGTQQSRIEGFATGPVSTDHALHALLEQAPSGTRAEDIEVILSFQTGGLGYCRELAMPKSRAVACKGASGWQIELATRTELGPTEPGFQPATTASDRAIDNWIDANIEGDPLGSDRENQVIDRAWLPQTD